MKHFVWLASLIAGAASAGPVIDQVYLPTLTNATVLTIGSARAYDWQGQQFTAGKSGYFWALDVAIDGYCIDSLGCKDPKATLALITFITPPPFGTSNYAGIKVLAQSPLKFTAVIGNPWPDPSTGNWHLLHIALKCAMQIQSGQQYAWVLHSSWATTGQKNIPIYDRLASDEPNPYTGGDAFSINTSDNAISSGATYSVTVRNDFGNVFRTWTSTTKPGPLPCM